MNKRDKILIMSTVSVFLIVGLILVGYHLNSKTEKTGKTELEFIIEFEKTIFTKNYLFSIKSLNEVLWIIKNGTSDKVNKQISTLTSLDEELLNSVFAKRIEQSKDCIVPVKQDQNSTIVSVVDQDQNSTLDYIYIDDNDDQEQEKTTQVSVDDDNQDQTTIVSVNHEDKNSILVDDEDQDQNQEKTTSVSVDYEDQEKTTSVSVDLDLSTIQVPHPAGPEEILRLGEAPRGQSPSLHPSIPLSGISNNFIMINSKFKVNDYFKQIISNAKIEPIYFNETKDDLDKINCLIEKQTNGKIVDVIQDIKETAFMIFNIIYFEFEWEHEFNENDTKLKNFTNYLKNTTEKKFMEMKNNYIDYRKQNEIEMISLNFNKSDLKMIFIKSTNLQKISNLTFDFIKMPVFISIPKFKIASEFDLLKSLTDMGISLRDKYCLDKFGDNLKIDKFIQKTFIDVSERKVEAASVTLFKPNFRSADYKKRINFILDEPFTFIIKDDKNIFFIGKYIE